MQREIARVFSVDVNDGLFGWLTVGQLPAEQIHLTNRVPALTTCCQGAKCHVDHSYTVPFLRTDPGHIPACAGHGDLVRGTGMWLGRDSLV